MRTVSTHQRAIDLYETHLANLPAVAYRDRGPYQARHAIAYAAAGDPEHAAALGHTALAIAQETGSTRISAELHRLDTALAPTSSSPRSLNSTTSSARADQRRRL